jgi:hypothetical protein
VTAVLTPDDIERRVGFHPADTPERLRAHQDVRQACRTLAVALNERLPEGRETDLALTLTEHVMFWANAAVARESKEN